MRETLGETGIRCKITGLVGVSTDPGHAIHYTSNNKVRQEFSAVLAARPVAEEPTPNSESTRVLWGSRTRSTGTGSIRPCGCASPTPWQTAAPPIG